MTSSDFNGLYVGPRQVQGDGLAAAIDLLEGGLLQVVTEDDYPNPSIRPWASRRPSEAQRHDLTELAEGRGWGACLYPTPAAMDGRIPHHQLVHEPYRRQLALGAGYLDLAYFGLDVLEHYRNDPRYHFSFSDCEVSFGISNGAYLDDDQPERDKITSLRVGFAYDRDALTRDEVHRYAATFISDLAHLTPEHQRRWETYEHPDRDSVSPHPMWWTMMMGNCPDGQGPFERILSEMSAINELFMLIFGMPLFHDVERPREWGWVLRASSGAWEEFVHTTDKLLSDNLSARAQRSRRTGTGCRR